MGRPTKSPEDKMERMVVMIAPWMAAEIDAAKGDGSRSDWIRNAILAKLANHADKSPRLKALKPKPKKAENKAGEPTQACLAGPEPKSQEIVPTGIKSGSDKASDKASEKPIQTVGLSASQRAAEIKARFAGLSRAPLGLSPGKPNPKTGKR